MQVIELQKNVVNNLEKELILYRKKAEEIIMVEMNELISRRNLILEKIKQTEEAYQVALDKLLDLEETMRLEVNSHSMNV